MKHQQLTQAHDPDPAPAAMPAAPSATRTHPALRLQRQIGNQAVQDLLQARLAVRPSGDHAELAADQLADQAVAPGAAPRRCACGGIAGPDGECSACKARRQGIQRQGTAGMPASAPSSVYTALRGPGHELDSATRAVMENRLGEDFGAIRLHTDAQAARSAQELGARAYTVGNNLVFGAGQYQPQSGSGLHLLAHELAHVLQQRTGAAPAVQRNGGTPQVPTQETPAEREATATANRQATAADTAARGAGPCGVVEATLSNAGLLFQLNRARVYLAGHKRGQDEWYDYTNLLRRLSSERQRRTRDGHVWLREPGLLQVPEELFALEPAAGLQVIVRRVPGSRAAGAHRASNVTLVTPAQFRRFLMLRNVPSVDAEHYLEGLDPTGQMAATLNLPPTKRTKRLQSQPPFGAYGPFAWTQPPPGSSYDPGSPWWINQRSGAPQFGPHKPRLPWEEPFTQTMTPWPYGEKITYVPDARETLNDLRTLPGQISSSGRERIFLPAPSPSQPTAEQSDFTPFLPPDLAGGPEGVGALGYLGRPGFGLPHGTTGIMWEGSHAIDIAVMNDRLFARGFRAPQLKHAWSKAERAAERAFKIERIPATTALNVGTKGSYAIDSLFPYTGELLGRGGEHWSSGAVAIVRADGTPIEAEQLMRLMAETVPKYKGETYRFSTPKPGTNAYKQAEAEAARQGIANWCDLGGRNCINLPIDIHRQALGGVDLVVTGKDGQPIQLSDPAHASAKNMSAFMNQPDSFFEQHGLRRVRIGQQAWAGVKVGAGLGAGVSLASDAWRAAKGEDVHFVRDAAISAGSSAASVIAEDVAYTYLATGLMSRGMSAGTASTLSRLGAGTGIGIAIAPITTGAEMLFDDEEYTGIDYAARMTRSGVAAGGGALATGLFFAVMGSEVPVAGNIAGFLIGVGAYYLTDMAVGEETEQAVREALGEGGCTEGVGPGR